ncbi:MAG: glycosyltransferase family 1 protein [Gemmataceae bacterium]|nr:glycosyltransferase family 1 protein [Gemmataceae bacterium]
MKVGIYQEPRGPAIGGGEYVLAVLAQAVRAAGHEVDVVHHCPDLTVGRVADFFRMDLTGVGERRLSPPGPWAAPAAPAWRLRAAMRGWAKDASEPYDLFVCVTHKPPPFCHARAGLLYVLFPTFDRWANWPWNVRPGWGLGAVKARLRRTVYEALWRDRMRSYSAVAAISEFARRWTSRAWGVDPAVIYPPVETDPCPGVKEDRVLVLGRFTPVKKQADLVRAFRRHRGRLPGWALACVGGMADTPAARAYLGEVERDAGADVELVVNAPRPRVHAELGRAKVFWHAMGIGVDETSDPGLIEHFGIATVEAMAAGCVPVVVDRGGQREIVTHGETGFLCSSFDEFAARTVELAADPVRLAKMAAAARDRAATFSRGEFVRRMMGALRPYLGGEGSP